MSFSKNLDYIVATGRTMGGSPKRENLVESKEEAPNLIDDGNYVAYKPITLPSILFIFIEIKFIRCYYCVMFAIKSMSICNV